MKVFYTLLLSSLLALSACSAAGIAPRSDTGAITTPPSANTSGATALATTVAGTSTSAGAGSLALSPSDPAYMAIRSVIQRANEAQQEAFTNGDPSPMGDTATADYYDQMAQINRDMAEGGVEAIRLIEIEWGDIALSGTTVAEATTYETWQATYADGSTDQSRDRNVYSLVLDRGIWKISDNEHPDAGQIAPRDSPGAPAPLPAPIPRPPGQLDQSRNWSGYEATGGKFTSVSGTWTIPQSDGGGQFASGATWVGIGGVQTRDLIQAGTQQTSSRAGQALYRAWIEMLPEAAQPVPLIVRPGDSVFVSIDQKDGDRWLISMKNETTGQSYQITVEYASSLSSAEWIVEAPSSGRRILPLDDFGSVEFAGATAIKNGKLVNLAQAGAKAITMVDGTGVPLAEPSTVSADGAGFSVTRTANSSTADPFGSGSGGRFVRPNGNRR